MWGDEVGEERVCGEGVGVFALDTIIGVGGRDLFILVVVVVFVSDFILHGLVLERGKVHVGIMLESGSEEEEREEDGSTETHGSQGMRCGSYRLRENGSCENFSIRHCCHLGKR